MSASARVEINLPAVVNLISYPPNPYPPKMPVFALPLPNNSSAPLPRPSYAPYPVPRRKRKRASSDSPDERSSPELESDHTHASTNPLSLTPAEIAQYRLAGLELNEELPSQSVHGAQDFPHRSLPIIPGAKEAQTKRDKGKDKEIERNDEYDTDTGNQDEDVEIEHRGRGPGLHLRHLSVLTTILHRCLLAGDIPRASRAWAILIREQFWGQPIDLKASGYWAIGAELLMRSGEGPRRNEDSEGSDGERRREEDGGEKRWGSAEGWMKAKAYYEQLILQYPYRRQFHRNTNAIDFWPAMVGCEIYGIQWEEREGLRKLERDDSVNEDEDETGPSEESEVSMDAQDDFEVATQRRIASRMRKREEKLRQAKEEIRLRTLGASEAVAARMDTLMSNLPYMDSRVLLRLRAMLALYIGDLSVPAVPVQRDEAEEGYHSHGGGKDSENRLLVRQRQAEYDMGKEKRREQRALAKRLVDKIIEKGGWVGDINYLGLEDDNDAEEEEVHEETF
jgi:hypothetical protein